MPQFIGAYMPPAFAGDLTRGSFDNTTEIKANDSTTPVTAFGVPVKWNANSNAVVAVSAANDSVIGFSVRKFTMVDHAGALNESFVTVLKRGYIAISCAGTPAAGGQVYLTAAGALTAASAGNTALTGAVFCGPATDGIVEIAYNL